MFLFVSMSLLLLLLNFSFSSLPISVARSDSLMIKKSKRVHFTHYLRCTSFYVCKRNIWITNFNTFSDPIFIQMNLNVWFDVMQYHKVCYRSSGSCFLFPSSQLLCLSFSIFFSFRMFIPLNDMSLRTRQKSNRIRKEWMLKTTKWFRQCVHRYTFNWEIVCHSNSYFIVWKQCH